ncbi:hypothetical protein [Streptacidiphilus sp. EB129]|jgi:hypothetical protein|uniref:hypothetical protein n=1 Tax=Streptacidiphilus sp. EB129 TaxID=3156262 RepID=UPI0035110F20
MHVYEMHAQYAGPGTTGPVTYWHMTSDGSTTALCGRDLDPDAAKTTDQSWSHTTEPVCHTCGALYLRQVA